jgi:2-keto-3-deoxygluconate permease
MVVPLLLAIIINTYIPEFFKIGGLTTSLFQNGDLVLLGLLFFLVGTQFQFIQSMKTWKVGFTLLILKLLIGSIVAFSVLYFFGFNGVFGITPLVLLIVLTQPNLAMYMAIILQFGRPSHLNMLPWLLLLETPLVILLILDISGMIETSLRDYFSMIMPFFLGVGIGYLIEGHRKVFSTMIPVIIPFFAFSVGSNFQVSDFIYSSLSGILITIFVLVSGVLIFFLLRLFSVHHATPGIALGSTASSSIFIIPILESLEDNRYIELIPLLTSQLITVTVLTCIFCPIIAKFLHRRKLIND